MNPKNKLSKDNIDKVIKTFKKNYKEIPLEVFKKNSYKSLVSTLLSSRTRDETTLEASKRLFEKAPDTESLGQLKQSEIRDLIYPVGFYRTKSKHLKELAKRIIKNHKGKVPRNRKELVKLPGVGRKTANIILNRVFDKPAIAVDTHVHKISNLLGWVKTKKPEDTEKELEKIIPKKYWRDINRLFVSIGRQYSTEKKLKRFLEKNRLINKPQ